MTLQNRTDRPAPHALLICPGFFSYQELIKSELERRGYVVTWLDDRLGKGTLYKLLLRLFPRTVTWLSTNAMARRHMALPGDLYSQVLVVKGEGYSPAAVASLRSHFPNARATLYLWDSVLNNSGAFQIARHFDTVATFDPVDAQRFGWKHRTMFAMPRPAPALNGSNTFAWSFIGTIHSDRARILSKLLSAYAGQLPCYIYGYFQSSFVMAVRYVLDRSLRSIPTSAMHTQPMAPADVSRIYACSAVILDIEHPDQRGLTLRAIESLLAGYKLVTTNKSVLQSDLYDPSRVAVISRDAPVIPADLTQAASVPVPAEVRRRYTVSAWLEDLLALPRSS